MKMNRWTMAACTLTFGIGGLAVFATDKTPTSELPPVPPVTNLKPPVSPVNGADTPSAPAKLPALEPVKEKNATFDFDLEVPSLPAKDPKKTEPMKTSEKIGQPSVLSYDKVPLNESKKDPKPAKESASSPIEIPALDIVPVKAESDPVKIPSVKPDAGKTTEPKPSVKADVPAVPPLKELDLDLKLPSAPKGAETTPPPSAPPLPSIGDVKPPQNDKAPTIGIPTPPSPEASKKDDVIKPKKAEEPKSSGSPNIQLDPPAPPVAQPKNPLPPPPPAVLTPKPETKPQTKAETKLEDQNEFRSKPEVATARLKMTLRMGDGRPRFEIRNSSSEEILLKVYGEKVEMTAPPEGKSSSVAGVSASGRVKFTAPGIEGTCDQLTILSGTGEVLMKGNIHLKTKRGKSWSEMTAEKMVYQIGNAGLGNAASTKNPVTPASFPSDE